MAAEWAPTIRVNAITPGFIETPRVAPSCVRLIRTRCSAASRWDVSAIRTTWPAAAVFLASDAASWITGIALDVTGGVAAPDRRRPR